jgi:hypothetical protein
MVRKAKVDINELAKDACPKIPPRRRFAYVLLNVAAQCNCWVMHFIKLSMDFLV